MKCKVAYSDRKQMSGDLDVEGRVRRRREGLYMGRRKLLGVMCMFTILIVVFASHRYTARVHIHICMQLYTYVLYTHIYTAVDICTV